MLAGCEFNSDKIALFDFENFFTIKCDFSSAIVNSDFFQAVNIKSCRFVSVRRGCVNPSSIWFENYVFAICGFRWYIL